MRGIATAVAAVMTATLAFGLAAASAQTNERTLRTNQLKQKQARKAPARPRTRITVQPRLRYRHDSTEFPRTDNLGYPGPNAVRQCVSWLAQEHRPSGTVIVPQMRCWWQGG